MKNFVFLFSLVAAFLLCGTNEATAQRAEENVSDVDSLVNQDTVVLNFDYVFKKPYYYSIQIQADSISGANAGTAYLQVTNDKAASPTRWNTLQTLTIDGATTSSATWEGLLYARKVRVYYISPSGTRRTDLYTYAQFKAVN